MACALTYDIWQYYSASVTSAGNTCGLNTTPNPPAPPPPASSSAAPPPPPPPASSSSSDAPPPPPPPTSSSAAPPPTGSTSSAGPAPTSGATTATGSGTGTQVCDPASSSLLYSSQSNPAANNIPLVISCADRFSHRPHSRRVHRRRQRGPRGGHVLVARCRCPGRRGPPLGSSRGISCPPLEATYGLQTSRA